MALRAVLFIWLIAVWGAVAPTLAQQAPPPQEPILRIDPGMHTAPITRIGVDAACTLLATASTDKTVRLWRLPPGKLLTTLRPPMGPDIEGQPSAVAVAPDGGWVALAATHPSQAASFVYIFQSATGALITRLGPLNEATVFHLGTSLDGRYLAAAGSDGGVYALRVWERAGADSTAWRLVAAAEEASVQVAVSAAFDKAGVLYTVATDGKLRRYARGWRGVPIASVLRGGKRPLSVAVSPSAREVAVGYEDPPSAVDVYDARRLAWRFKADIKRASGGHFGAVAWSADGKRLYAGGQYPADKRSSILVWDRVGKGRPREFEGPENTIAQLLPCGDGLVMGAQDPAFGILAPDGVRRLWQERVQADVRTQRTEDFRVSADGRRVQFGLEEMGKNSVLFDLSAEQLAGVSERAGDLAAADTASLPITDWHNNSAPKLRGQPLELEQPQTSRSLAIAPDKQRFVLGTEWQLRTYQSDGTLLWRKLFLRTAWGVNIARDGKLVVVAYGDGTIRWHRLNDGEELLTLFVHAKDRRWVAWTPKGYYLASPGAESLIGWHVNRGWDEAAQFFPADRFRAQFNRPDIVKLVLETLDETKAIEEANRRAGVRRAEEDVRKLAPPIVVIQKPGDGATFRTPEVVIDYDVHPASGRPITKFEYWLNGSALGARMATQATPGKTTSHKLHLTLEPKDVKVSIVVYEGDTPSEPATRRLRWGGPKPGQEHLKRLRALFVGVNKYAKLRELQFASKDAADLAALFKSHEGRSYSKVEAKVLSDARLVDVIEGLEWLENGSVDGDVNLLFLAGHGTTDERQHFYFMAADSDPGKLRTTAVDKDDILRTIRNLKGTRVVMLDTCRAGASTDAAALAAPSSVDMNRAPNEIGDKTLGVLLYASAQARQVSLEYPEWGNGAFTKAMIEGLGGAADSGKLGYVDSEELSLYVRRRVMALTREKGLLQVPVRVNPQGIEMKLVQLKK